MKKFILRWGAFVLAAIMYLGILAIPFASVSKTGYLKIGESKYLLTKNEIILECILVAILVAILVYCIRSHAKIARGAKSYESEIKRIAWLPREQTKKSSLVVIAVMIVFAVVICLLDWGLGKGYVAFIDLFN